MGTIIHFDGSKGRTKVGHEVGHLSDDDRPLLSDEKISEIRGQGLKIDAQALSDLTGASVRHIRRRCAAGKYVNARQVLGNGGMQWRIPLDDVLPELRSDVREWLLRALGGREKPSAEDLAERDRRFIERGHQANYNVEAVGPRYAIIRHYRAFLQEEQGKLLDRKDRWMRFYESGGFAELERPRQHYDKVHWKTVDRWIKELEAAEGDTFGLATRYGKSRGKRSVTPVVADTMLRFAMNGNRLLHKEVIRLTRRDLELRGLSCPLSDATLSRWLSEHRRNNDHMYTLVRDGYKALMDRIVPSLRRDYGDLRPGDVLIADGHELNFDVINPATGKPKRMTLVMVMDMATNMPLGWEISATENTASIFAAFERAIRRMGFVPKVFYLDNGRAFSSKAINGLSNQVDQEGFCALVDRLQPYGYLETQFALPYNGRAKTIERQFLNVHEFEKWMGSYRGNSIGNKVARLHRNEKLAIALHERWTGGVTPSVQETHFMFIEWLKEFTARPTSKDSMLKGRSPMDAWNEGMELVRSHAEFENRQVTDDSLRFMMMGQETKSLDQQGVKLFGVSYWAEELYGFAKRSQKFVIRYDITDMKEVYVFDETGSSPICVARADAWSGHHPQARQLGTAEDQARLKEGMTNQRSLVSTTVRMAKEFYRAVESEQLRLPVTVKDLQEAQKAKKAQLKTGTVDAEPIPEEYLLPPVEAPEEEDFGFDKWDMLRWADPNYQKSK